MEAFVTDMCIDMYAGMCIDMYVGICTDMCIHMYVGICTDMCIGMYVGICYRHVYRHVCRRVYRHTRGFDAGSRLRYRSWWSEKKVFTPFCHFTGFFASKSNLKSIFIPYFDREGDLAQQ